MLYAVDQLAKGTTAIMHQMVLLRKEVEGLRTANEALSKRRRAKKTRLRLGGSLTVQEATDIIDQKAIDGQLVEESRQAGRKPRGGEAKVWCCGRCRKPGHIIRMCPEAVEDSDTSIEDAIEVIE